MKLSNLTIKNAFYFLQGYWRAMNYKILKSLVKRLGWYDRQVARKKALCPECFAAGQCLVCECSIMEMAYSEKPCPNGKF